METGHPSTRAVNSGSGNRALFRHILLLFVNYHWIMKIFIHFIYDAMTTSRGDILVIVIHYTIIVIVSDWTPILFEQNGGRTAATVDDQQTSESDFEGAKYKKVAIVEDFFDIIYNVHVDMDGRGGKHAGQKRTYRAVSSLQCCYRERKLERKRSNSFTSLKTELIRILTKRNWE